MNALIWPLSNIAKKLNIHIRTMYPYPDKNGDMHPGRLDEMAKLGICFLAKMNVGRGKRHSIKNCWCAWENHLELYTQMKAEKGEVIGKVKNENVV